jgi:hypothetical protein
MKWIKCSKMLPEQGIDVLIHIKDNDSCPAELAIDYISKNEDGNMWTKTTDHYVTHWMALPDFPKAE